MSHAPNTSHSTKAMPLVLSYSFVSQRISKRNQSFFMFLMLPEKSSAFLKMFKNLHFTNCSVIVNAPSQTMCCHQLSSMAHHTHLTVKTCQQWLLLCNYVKNEAIQKTGCCSEREHFYIPSCAPSPVLAEFLGIIFKQTQLSCGCWAHARLMGTGNTGAA